MFSLKFSGGVSYYTVDEFEDTGRVKTCFSTRIGGVSGGGYSSLNVGYKTGDDISNVDKNFSILSEAAGFRLEDMVLTDQVHGDRCLVVKDKDRGKGTIKKSDITGIDALISCDRNTALCIFTADCVPVFIFDRSNNIVALCHAGWRGVVNGIVINTINKMVSEFNTNPLDILAAIGPSIGPCCFNVGYEVVQEFENKFGCRENIIIENGKSYKIDLWNAMICQLENIGVQRNNIICSRMCTSCKGDTFYSYRRDGKETGRMVSIIQLI